MTFTNTTLGNNHKPRVSYLDVAKGIMIILVIVHHIPQVIKAEMGSYSGCWADIRSLNFLYANYVMQTFFVISGICCNFNKPFVPFLWSNVKTILLPALLLPILCDWIINIFQLNFHPSDYLHFHLPHTLIQGPINWFLPTLLIAKLLYWIIHHLFQPFWTKLLIGVCLLTLGCMLNELDIVPNYWMHRHALSMIFFLCVGQWLEKHHPSDLLLWTGASVFLVMTFCIKFTTNAFCWITNSYHVSPTEIPLHLLLGITGSCLILVVSKLIHNNRILESIGRNSLVFYVFHFQYLRFIASHFSSYLSQMGYGESCCLALVMLCSAILLSYLLARLLNTRYLKFSLGKF